MASLYYSSSLQSFKSSLDEVLDAFRGGEDLYWEGDNAILLVPLSSCADNNDGDYNKKEPFDDTYSVAALYEKENENKNDYDKKDSKNEDNKNENSANTAAALLASEAALEEEVDEIPMDIHIGPWEDLLRGSTSDTNENNTNTATPLLALEIVEEEVVDEIPMDINGSWEDSLRASTLDIHGSQQLVNQFYVDQLLVPPPVAQPRPRTRWSDEEHKLFLEGVQRYGRGNWKRISAELLATRTVAQIASHAQKYFIRLDAGNSNV